MASQTENIKIALDWLPNINHLGFFVAANNGFFKAEGLQVQFIVPKQESISHSPVRLLETGEAQFCLSSSKDIVYMATQTDRPSLVSLGSCIRVPTQCILVRADSDIHRFKDLDGKKFASYGGAHEVETINYLIKKDGGKGTLAECTRPQATGCWDDFINKKCDAITSYSNVGPFEAKKHKVAVRVLSFAEVGVPNVPSPHLATLSKFTVPPHRDMCLKVVRAVTKGYQYAAKMSPEDVVDLWTTMWPELKYNETPHVLAESFNATKNHFVDPTSGEWGRVADDQWNRLLQFMSDAHLLKNERNQEVSSKEVLATHKLFQPAVSS